MKYKKHLLLLALLLSLGAAQAAWIMADSFEGPADPMPGANGNLWDQMQWDNGIWQ